MNHQKILEDIKSRVDAIDTFPVETEKPVVSEVLNRRQVINIAIAGDVDEKTLKVLAEGIREDLLASTKNNTSICFKYKKIMK